MTKRRLIRWSLLLVTLAAFTVWLEPTRVVWGWLCGEAFYQGRPTSYWAGQVARWETSGGDWRDEPHATWYFAYNSNAFEKWTERYRDPLWLTFPAILDDDMAAQEVLGELVANPNPEIGRIARERLRGRKMSPLP